MDCLLQHTSNKWSANNAETGKKKPKSILPWITIICDHFGKLSPERPVCINKDGKYSIGCHPGNDLQIPADYSGAEDIADYHAFVKEENGSLYLTTNRAEHSVCDVEGKRISCVKIRDGSEYLLGRFIRIIFCRISPAEYFRLIRDMGNAGNAAPLQGATPQKGTFDNRSFARPSDRSAIRNANFPTRVKTKLYRR